MGKFMQNKITLQYIRECKSFDDLKPAILFLCDNMQAMTWGEFVAFQRTIETQTKKLGLSLKAMNE